MRGDSVLSQYNLIPYVFVASQASVWEASYWQHQQPGVLTTSTELVMFSFIVCMALCRQLLRPLSRYMHRRLVILLKIMHVDTVQAIACLRLGTKESNCMRCIPERHRSVVSRFQSFEKT